MTKEFSLKEIGTVQYGGECYGDPLGIFASAGVYIILTVEQREALDLAMGLEW